MICALLEDLAILRRKVYAEYVNLATIVISVTRDVVCAKQESSNLSKAAAAVKPASQEDV